MKAGLGLEIFLRLAKHKRGLDLFGKSQTQLLSEIQIIKSNKRYEEK